MKTMTIKHKLWLLLAGVLLTLAGIWLTERHYQRIGESAHMARERLATLESELLTLRQYEQAFLGDKRISSAQAFDNTFELYLADTRALRDHMSALGLEVDTLDTIDQQILRYQQQFAEVVAKQQLIGLDHNDALYGALRDAAHGVESVVRDYPPLLAQLLMLRRHEKDFMLRRLDKYPQRFMSTLTEFRSALFISDIDYAVLAKAQVSLRQYADAFENLVQAEREIGLSEGSGLIGETAATITAAKTAFQSLRDQLDLRLATIINESATVSGVMVAGMSALIALFLIILTRDLTRSLSRGVDAAHAMARGEYHGRIAARRNDEVGELLRALEGMRKEVQLHTGRLAEDARIKSALSDLGQQLNGIADLDTLGQTAIRHITPAAGCLVGTLYVYRDEALEFVSGYGIPDRTVAQRRYALGESLIGQAALERRMMLLEDLPANYLPIQSGTGSAAPAALMVAPLMWNDTLYGALELAAFEAIGEDSRGFVEQCGELLAVAIHACLARMNSESLLNEARDSNARLEQQTAETEAARKQLQAQAEQLQASEEELRVQQEELQAQQEELRVTNEELEAQTRLLHTRTQELEQRNRMLESRDKA